jgi:hypothetical protein
MLYVKSLSPTFAEANAENVLLGQRKKICLFPVNSEFKIRVGR